jgi:hypothetical protein
MTEPKFFQKCGEALFGTHWRVELAAALNVSERTVRRWEKGLFEIPDGVWEDLKHLLGKRAKALLNLEARIGADYV